MKSTLFEDLKALHEAYQVEPNGPALHSALGRLLDQHTELVPLSEFAKLADVTTRAVLHWIEAGTIEAENRGKGEKRPRYFIAPSELQKVNR